MSLCARPCALRSWWNSWWKYRRPCLSLRCSGLRNSSSTFQFLVVEGEFLVLKVFFPGRVQQRFMVPWNAFLSGLWRRTLISPSVEASKIFSQDRLLLHLHLQLMVSQMSLAKGFFRTFPQNKKSAELSSHSGSELASAPQLIHGGGSAGGLRRVGEVQGEARWQDVLLEQTY